MGHRLSPAQSQKINGLPAEPGFGEGQPSDRRQVSRPKVSDCLAHARAPASKRGLRPVDRLEPRTTP